MSKAEEYSFNIQSELFQQLTTEQQKLWKKEIEQAYNAGTALKEEHVSEELKTELNKYIKDHFTIDKEQLDRFGVEEKDYMYSMDRDDMLNMIKYFIK